MIMILCKVFVRMIGNLYAMYYPIDGRYNYHKVQLSLEEMQRQPRYKKMVSSPSPGMSQIAKETTTKMIFSWEI